MRKRPSDVANCNTLTETLDFAKAATAARRSGRFGWAMASEMIAEALACQVSTRLRPWVAPTAPRYTKRVEQGLAFVAIRRMVIFVPLVWTVSLLDTAICKLESLMRDVRLRLTGSRSAVDGAFKSEQQGSKRKSKLFQMPHVAAILPSGRQGRDDKSSNLRY
jgi:hypothetical protein